MLQFSRTCITPVIQATLRHRDDPEHLAETHGKLGVTMSKSEAHRKSNSATSHRL